MKNSNTNQDDRNKYLRELVEEGSIKYSWLYASGQAPENPDQPISVSNPPKGLPDEDLKHFLTIVYLQKDNHDEFAAIRAEKQARGEKGVVHIDTGVGSNLDSIIAGLAEADESIAVELAPANINVLKKFKHNLNFVWDEAPDYIKEHMRTLLREGEEPHSPWEDWLDIARIAHDVGSPENFLNLDKNVFIEGLDTSPDSWLPINAEGEVNLYDAIRKWPVLSESNKRLIEKRIYAEAGVERNPENPYLKIQEEGLQNVLERKLTIRQGDNFNPLGDEGVENRFDEFGDSIAGFSVPSIADLKGKADLDTQKYVTESNTLKVGEVLHGEFNIAQLGAPKSYRVASYMSGTDSYDGFLTPEQLVENPDQDLKECPMSTRLIQLFAGHLVTQDPRYLPLTDDTASLSDDRKMIRPGKSYTGAVIVAGLANYTKENGELKFKDSTDFMNQLRDQIITIGKKQHFTKGEPENVTRAVVEQADKDLNTIGNERGIGKVQLGHSAFNWETLDDDFWERYANRHYNNPQKIDIDHLLSVVLNVKSKTTGEDNKEKDTTFISVRTASAPQYAFAAIQGGMDHVITSHQGQSGINWLEKNLLSDSPTPKAAERIQMWWEITQILSTFRSQEELTRYGDKSGLSIDLNNWGNLSDNEKDVWFAKRLRLANEHGVKDHFIQTDDQGKAIRGDARATIQAMAAQGKFKIEKFSPMSIPNDLKGTADIVEASYITDSISQIPSERLDCAREICSLAKEDGYVHLAESSYTNWDVYQPGQSLPGIELPLSYLSLTAKICADGAPSHDNAAELHDLESHTVRQDNRRRLTGAQREFDQPLDSRFDYLEHVAFRPSSNLQQKSGQEILAELHQEILEETKRYLFEHPDSPNLDHDAFKTSIETLEENLGMPPHTEESSSRPTQLEKRINTIKAFIMERQDDPNFMNRVVDVALAKFLESTHDNLIDRERDTQPMKTFANRALNSSGYVGARI